MSEVIKGLEFSKITIDEAKNRFSGYPYAIVHMMSELQYGRTEDISVNWDELIELRAFSETEELRVYQGNSGMTAQCCTEVSSVSDDAVLIEYEMRNGGRLSVKEYLEPDEDGQAVVVYTRPCGMVIK